MSYLYLFACVLSHIRLFLTPRTAACQTPPTMGFSRQEYWSEFLSIRGLLDSGIESTSPALAGGFFTAEPLGLSSYSYVNFHQSTYNILFRLSKFVKYLQYT